MGKEKSGILDSQIESVTRLSVMKSLEEGRKGMEGGLRSDCHVLAEIR